MKLAFNRVGEYTYYRIVRCICFKDNQEARLEMLKDQGCGEGCLESLEGLLLRFTPVELVVFTK